MNVIDRIKATCDRNRQDYEFLAGLTGRTVAEVEGDVCAPDPGSDSADPIGGKEQLFNRVIELPDLEARFVLGYLASDLLSEGNVELVSNAINYATRAGTHLAPSPTPKSKAELSE